MKRVRENSVRGKQLAYIIIVTANHLPEGHLLTQTVCGFIRVEGLTGEVRHWHMSRGWSWGCSLFILCDSNLGAGRQ
jgi:hypothetical protein